MFKCNHSISIIFDWYKSNRIIYFIHKKKDLIVGIQIEWVRRLVSRQSSIYKVILNKLILLANMHINQLLKQRSDSLIFLKNEVKWNKIQMYRQATQLLLMKLHEIVAKKKHKTTKYWNVIDLKVNRNCNKNYWLRHLVLLWFSSIP